MHSSSWLHRVLTSVRSSGTQLDGWPTTCGSVSQLTANWRNYPKTRTISQRFGKFSSFSDRSMMKGEVCWVTPRQRRGREQQKRRLCVVVQSASLGLTSTVVVVPLTSSQFGPFWHPRIESHDGPSFAMTTQVSATDRASLEDAQWIVSAEEMWDIEDGLRRVLGLN